MKKLHLVELTDTEREMLLTLTRKGEIKARKLRRAQILLLADQKKTDEEIQAALGVSIPTIYRTRQRFAQEDLNAALSEKPRCGGPRKLDAKGEALLVATACSTPPDGRVEWSMQLLADRMVVLGVVGELSDETVRLILKKSSSSRG